jgi:hypothetical protein
MEARYGGTDVMERSYTIALVGRSCNTLAVAAGR